MEEPEKKLLSRRRSTVLQQPLKVKDERVATVRKVNNKVLFIVQFFFVFFQYCFTVIASAPDAMQCSPAESVTYVNKFFFSFIRSRRYCRSLRITELLRSATFYLPAAILLKKLISGESRLCVSLYTLWGFLLFIFIFTSMFVLFFFLQLITVLRQM